MISAGFQFSQFQVARVGYRGCVPDQRTSVRTLDEETRQRARLPALIALTKPRIIELLLVTTVPPMMLAARGWPGTSLVLATLVGGTLSAAGANALNCYFDRDIDALMQRTARRPLPAEEVEPSAALVLGTALGVGGFAWLAVTVNVLAALLTTGALLFYVLVYTKWLKRRTDQNIVIGGAAGAVPVLVGWAAVTGTVGVEAWILFAVVFYWTPAHFWALALRYESHYARAEVPMLPVTKGVEVTSVHIVAYAGLTVFASFVLIPLADMGPLYAVPALVLGVWFFGEAWKTFRRPESAMTLFVRSTYYLALLFGAVGADALTAQ
jgi:heme o synthase